MADFWQFPIIDRSVPTSRKATLEFVKKLAKLLAEGKSIAIHCRQGIGRSALMAACLLVLFGIDPEAAFQRVSEGRGCSVPETWVMEFAQGYASLFTKE
jgi:protein-tyrosine phosphatase